jgi:putative thioesterase domain protein
MKQGRIRLAAVKQLTRPEEIVARIREIYVPNHFMSDYFHIDIDDIRCGKVMVSLLTDPRKHTNHREVLHGGVMMALADSVTGVTGASVGAVVVTVSLTMSFIRNARPGSRIRVKSHITHNGRTTIVIAAEMYDEDDKLMANILADMMIVDHFPEIPRKW